jgi:hypothetical protein
MYDRLDQFSICIFTEPHKEYELAAYDLLTDTWQVLQYMKNKPLNYSYASLNSNSRKQRA